MTTFDDGGHRMKELFMLEVRTRLAPRLTPEQLAELDRVLGEELEGRNLPYFFKYTISSMMSLLRMPLMREACPSVTGRIFSSLRRDSALSETILP